MPGYFLRKTSVKRPFLVISSLNLKPVHDRQNDVDPLCCPANRGSSWSSAGSFSGSPKTFLTDG